ncbi:beta-ketoacyl-[acyl-carrier-protein] synthase family protein [Ktedonospora formicarum]|nr:beta-ketoacyl-[acyl-carrier-protein] synthase family protein [Ktedonospora formicarum]
MVDKQQRRVAITGLGVVAPNGIGVANFWQATQDGVSGITCLAPHEGYSHTGIPHWVAGTIRDFLAEDYIDRKLANRTDRMTHFAFAAIQEAITDAGLELTQEIPRRIGAVIANTMGGVEFVLKQIHTLYTRGPRFVSAYTAIAWLNVANVGQAAIRYNIQGYCKTPVNDAVSGLNALGMAANAIRRNVADVIIAGGCEAFLHPLLMRVLAQQGVCTTSTDPHAYRPFDQRASGLILAEGAGICILEEYEHARRRGAPIYGELVGYGQSNDAHGLNGPSNTGKQYARAIQQAMHEGNLSVDDLAYFQLDGRAHASADEGEAAALHMTLGDASTQLPVSVPRTTIGHSYAAAGAIDTVTALLALKHATIPPTRNCDEPNPRYALDLVRDEARPIRTLDGASPSAVLIGGRGIGGTNVVLAVKR